MEIHRSKSSARPSFLFIDSEERIAVLPTDFVRSLSQSPRNRAAGTLALYSDRLRNFCSFLEEHPVYGQVRVDDAIKAIGFPIIDVFFKHCEAQGLGRSSVRGHEVVLKMFTNWLSTAEANRARDTALYDHQEYRTTSPSKRMPRYLTYHEVINLISAMHWEIQRLVTHFIFDTGLRVSEVRRVLKSDIPLIEHYPSDQMYFPLFVRGSKGRGGEIKERYTMISRPMLTRIFRYFNSRSYFTNHEWPENKKPAFLNTYGIQLQPKAIQKFISDARNRTSLPSASPHRLRHGTAYSVMRSELGKSLLDNLVILQRSLGHSDISTTEIYTHIPAPMLSRMRAESNSQEVKFRFEEAQLIFEKTFLPEKKHMKVRLIGKLNEFN